MDIISQHIARNKDTIYTEKAAYYEMRYFPRTLLVRGIGNSMTPLLVSRQIVRVDPAPPDVVLSKGDIVLCKIRGRIYLHKVTALKDDRVQIGNNHGHINGWCSRAQVVGKVIL